MAINITVPEMDNLHPRITVFGVGGAGGNAVNNMVDAHLQGVDFVVANTDSQALHLSKADSKLQLGGVLTEGLGAGAKPEVGRAAAEEDLGQIEGMLENTHMIFITAGMGGGTGSGGAPVIAKAAREKGILTVGVVTKPFHFEGKKRMEIAESAIEELSQHVDTLIVIPNQNLFRIANERTTIVEAFGMADEVLHAGVRGITDLMIQPGLINLDFADVRTVMAEMGKAMMGTGEAEGDNRAIAAAESAISNPLLDDVSMKGAKGVLINITGGMDMTLFEVDEAANRIREEVDPDANIIVGSTFNDELTGCMRVSIVATGIDAELGFMPRPDQQLFHTVARPAPSQMNVPAEEPAAEVEVQEVVAEQAPEPELLLEEEAVEVASAQPSEQVFSMKAEHVAVAQPVAGDRHEATVGTMANEAAPVIQQPVHSEEAVIVEKQPEAVTRPSLDGSGLGDVPAAQPVARREPFIAAPAVRPTLKAEPIEAPAQANPFREAEMQNAAQSGGQAQAAPQPVKRRGPSLMQRLANVGRSMDATSQAARTTDSMLRKEPAQQSLNTEPAERPSSLTQNEEQLEIPAFLRRQAN